MTTKLDMLAKLQEQKCLDNSDLLEDKKEKASIWFASLRDEICKSFEEIEPAECFPTASKTSTTVTSFPLYLPGKIEPP